MSAPLLVDRKRVIVLLAIAGFASSANQRMQEHLLNGKNLFGDRIQELQISAASRTSINDGLNVNRRIAVRPIRTGQEGNPDLAMGVSIDINTLAEEPYDLSTADLEKFLQGVSTHIQTRIPLLQEASLFE